MIKQNRCGRKLSSIGTDSPNQPGPHQEMEKTKEPSKADLEWNFADDDSISAFLCPITQEVMHDPVIAADGMRLMKNRVY